MAPGRPSKSGAGSPAPFGRRLLRTIAEYVPLDQRAAVQAEIAECWGFYQALMVARAELPSDGAERKAGEALEATLRDVRKQLRSLPPRLEARLHKSAELIDGLCNDTEALRRKLQAALVRMPKKGAAGRPSRAYADELQAGIRAVAQRHIGHGQRQSFVKAVMGDLGITPRK